MDTVNYKTYSDKDIITDEPVQTPQFSTEENEFEVRASECKEEFLCLTREEQDVFLQKLSNSEVSVKDDSIIAGMFDKYCLNLGDDEKELLAEELVQSRIENSEIEQNPSVNIDNRNSVQNTNDPQKVTQAANVVSKQVDSESAKSGRMAKVKAFWGKLSTKEKIGATIATLAAFYVVDKTCNKLILGSWNGKMSDGREIGWVHRVTSNVLRSVFNAQGIEIHANEAGAKAMLQKNEETMKKLQAFFDNYLAKLKKCKGTDNPKKPNDVKKRDQIESKIQALNNNYNAIKTGISEVNKIDIHNLLEKDYSKLQDKLDSINTSVTQFMHTGSMFSKGPLVFDVNKGEDPKKSILGAYDMVRTSPIYQLGLKATGIYSVMPSKYGNLSLFGNITGIIVPVIATCFLGPVGGLFAKATISVLSMGIKFAQATEAK